MAIIKKLAGIALLVLTSLLGIARVSLPAIFQSSMVLQRDKVISIWGFGDPAEKVVLEFNNKQYKGITAKDGKWIIKLPAQQAGGPHTIYIKTKANTIELTNILFGDVWICGGQSNMQFSLDQIGYTPADTAAMRKSRLRLFTASIDMDYVPKKDLAGGVWQEASVQTIKNFSATAYFFGRFLSDSLQVPIGLVSDNLGATSVESWMSAEALSKFPQFDNFLKLYLQPGKSFQQITTAFEKMKPGWESDYYHKGEGIQKKWFLPATDISGWKTMEMPGWWEDKGLKDFDGAIWFRKTFDLPANFKGDAFSLPLNQIDDYDMVWVNGVKIGEGFGNLNWRNYSVPASSLKATGNTIVVRVFDAGGRGGMYSAAFWGDPFLLGRWLYKEDNKIDATTFPKPHVVNASPFSTPAVLYNGNIAPLTSLSIKGFIWYQGESNASRAAEYRDLFPAFIKDWRNHFNQGDLPFIFVQLANYMQEVVTPVESDWAELRDGQKAALQLPNTAMAVAIDIGDANDIHPKNKMDVGKRLGLAALKVAYQVNVVSQGPTFESMQVQNDSVTIRYTKETSDLQTKNKYGYVSGFALAGADNKFHWASAIIRNNTVVVHCSAIKNPVAVRYAWSDNPGTTDLYNKSGLPAVPFRTDTLPFKTRGKLFSENPWEF